jgi:sugar lactone lactonase YvrE
MDGSISAWNGGSHATIMASVPGASFTGLAIANNKTGAAFLYAADQNSDDIDVLNSQWKMVGEFTDSHGLPGGFNAFNVQNLDGLLYVTYTNQNVPSGGIVDVFNPDGTFIKRLIDDPTGKRLDNPWGLAIAPANFGKFGGDLLVGNNGGNNWINAFDPVNGHFEGTLTLSTGQPFSENNLWALTFGNGASGGGADTLYFTAGIGGTDGLFGSLQAIPSLSPRAPIVPNLPQSAIQTVSTIPANGDLNPYGVAFVPQGFPTGGVLQPGDVLVSNFNNSGNQQGTGSTIVAIAPNGSESLFFKDSTPSGLTTALGVLKSGFVIVGNLPATYNSNGKLVSIGQGSLRILDRYGNVVTTLSDNLFLDGPWDLTVNDQGSTAQVFVSNVLNGEVTRIDLTIRKGGDPIIESLTRIASGYSFTTNPSALVLGPTGLAYDPRSGTLYVASTADNEIFAIPNAATRTSNAGTGRVVYQDNAHLRGPLGLVLAPNGDLITSNGDAVNADSAQPSELVEFTPNGKFVGEFSLDSAEGGAFGLAVTDVGGLLRLAAVDDNTNSLDVWTFDTRGGSPNLPFAFSAAVSASAGNDAAGVDQLFLTMQEEELRSALFGQPNGTSGSKKNSSDL